MDINQSGLLLLTRLLPTLDEIGSQEAGDDNSRPEHGVMPGFRIEVRSAPFDEIGSQEAGDDNSRPEHGVMPGFRIEVRSAPYRAARGHSHEEGGTLSSGIYHPTISELHFNFLQIPSLIL
ncbi:hypothetical protein QE152_g1816 [Popillia japonica]|uniref:Uncharacterized protein n=1 Tax=Popillia japonica TaxID=7064 RepID=A0AAW1N104_POPJA